MRRVLLWSSVALLALVGAVIGFLLLVDLSAYRTVVEARASALLGRSVTIAGGLDINLSLIPTLAATQVTIANLPDGSREDMARIGQIDIEFDLLSLLDRGLRINNITASDADIVLEFGGDGIGNWVLGPGGAEGDRSQAPSGDGGILILQVELRDSIVAHTGVAGIMRHMDIAHASVTASRESGTLEIEIDSVINEQPVQGTATTGSLNAFFASDADWPVAFSLSLGDSRVSGDGTIADTTTFSSYSLDLDADMDSAEPIVALLGHEPPPLPRFQFRGAVSRTVEELRFTGFSVTSGGSDFSGDLVVSLTGERRAMSGDLTARRLDLADVPAGWSENPIEPGEDPVIPAAILDWADLDLQIEAEELALVLLGLTVSDIRGSVRLVDRRLEFGLERARFFDGEVTGSAMLDVRTMPGTAEIDLRTSQLDVGGLLRDLQISDGVAGRADAELTLTGSGMSLLSMLRSAHGRVEIEMVSGKVLSKTLQDVQVHAPTIVLPIGVDETLELLCFVGHFDVADGLADSTALFVDSQKATIAGEGLIDLAGNQMDFVINARSKNPNEVDLAVPVRVYGRINDPDISIFTEEFMASAAAGLLLGALIDPLAIIIPFLAGGTGEDTPCLAATRD